MIPNKRDDILTEEDINIASSICIFLAGFGVCVIIFTIYLIFEFLYAITL